MIFCVADCSENSNLLHGVNAKYPHWNDAASHAAIFTRMEW